MNTPSEKIPNTIRFILTISIAFFTFWYMGRDFYWSYKRSYAYIYLVFFVLYFFLFGLSIYFGKHKFIWLLVPTFLLFQIWLIMAELNDLAKSPPAADE